VKKRPRGQRDRKQAVAKRRNVKSRLDDAMIRVYDEAGNVIEPTFRQLGGKPKRARKGDLNQIAASIVEQTTREKNPAAVELGRLGGLKGGKARAKSLSPKRRKQIARDAALRRWDKRPS
jgi:hypothetical protein